MARVEHPQQPVGQRRFAAPAPLLPWTGVRDAWLAFATEGWLDGQAWCDYVPYRPRYGTPRPATRVIRSASDAVVDDPDVVRRCRAS